MIDIQHVPLLIKNSSRSVFANGKDISMLRDTIMIHARNVWSFPSISVLAISFGYIFVGVHMVCTAKAVEPAKEKSQISLTLVNALPGPENLHVLMASQELWPPGFTPGQSTGGVILPGGKPAMEARCAGFVSTKFTAELPNRANCAMVFYPGEEIKDGPDKGKRKIGVFFPPPILEGQAPKAKNWQALLVGPLTEAALSFNDKPIRLSIGQPLNVEGRGGVDIKSDGKPLYSSNPDDSGNFWLIIFGEAQEKLSIVQLNHIYFEIP